MARYRRGRSYGRNRGYKAGLRKGKRRAMKQMSRYIPMMQRLGIRK